MCWLWRVTKENCYAVSATVSGFPMPWSLMKRRYGAWAVRIGGMLDIVRSFHDRPQGTLDKTEIHDGRKHMLYESRPKATDGSQVLHFLFIRCAVHQPGDLETLKYGKQIALGPRYDFSEDYCKTRTKYTAQNFAMLSKICLNILKKSDMKVSIKEKEKPLDGMIIIWNLYLKIDALVLCLLCHNSEPV